MGCLYSHSLLEPNSTVALKASGKGGAILKLSTCGLMSPHCHPESVPFSALLGVAQARSVFINSQERRLLLVVGRDNHQLQVCWSYTLENDYF